MKKRAAIVFGVLLSLAACGREIDEEKFESCYRAAKEIQGAIAVGVNYMKFSELLQKLSTETQILKDVKKTEKEKAIAGQYDTLLVVYKDSFELWQLKNGLGQGQYYVDCGYENNILPVCQRLQKKYGIALAVEDPTAEREKRLAAYPKELQDRLREVTPFDEVKSYHLQDSEAAMRAIWNHADQLIETITKDTKET